MTRQLASSREGFRLVSRNLGIDRHLALNEKRDLSTSFEHLMRGAQRRSGKSRAFVRTNGGTSGRIHRAAALRFTDRTLSCVYAFAWKPTGTLRLTCAAGFSRYSGGDNGKPGQTVRQPVSGGDADTPSPASASVRLRTKGLSSADDRRRCCSRSIFGLGLDGEAGPG